VTEPTEISRRVRKEIRGRGVRANLAADIAVAVAGGGTATVRQHSSISQGGATPAPAADDKEQQP
jgi:hypothetical protein